jgi:hypothetical protein
MVRVVNSAIASSKPAAGVILIIRTSFADLTCTAAVEIGVPTGGLSRDLIQLFGAQLTSNNLTLSLDGPPHPLP